MLPPNLVSCFLPQYHEGLVQPQNKKFQQALKVHLYYPKIYPCPPHRTIILFKKCEEQINLT